MKRFMFLLALVVCLGACNKSGEGDAANKGQENKTANSGQKAAAATDNAGQAKVDADLIAKYIKDNNLSTTATSSGIHYVIEKEGSGDNPKAEDRVEVHYKGTLLDGTEFDSSYKRNAPAKFPLRGVIKGWQEAIPFLKPGGKGKFIIPSALAYGPRKVGAKIAPNSVLVFDVELLNIVK